MLEKPAVADAAITACLQRDYGLALTGLTFLPLGADAATAVYRAETLQGRAYFAKLRRGPFNPIPIQVPRLLADQGHPAVIPPLRTMTGLPWARLDDFTLIVFPFVAGRTAIEAGLSDQQWHDFGRALHALHTADLPPALLHDIPHEVYSDEWRAAVRRLQVMPGTASFDDLPAAGMAALLQAQRATIDRLVTSAARLAGELRARALPLVLCHADIHAWNVLIDADDRLYLVDWDTVILAPKEHDLMFIGGGIGAVWNTSAESALFYAGYGDVDLDPAALAYYRCERVVQDIAAYGEQLLLTSDGGADRAAGLRALMGQFEPGGVVEIALRTAAALP